MEQFVYVLRPVRVEMVTDGPTPEERRSIGEHVGYLSGLTASGNVILFGRTQAKGPDVFGLVILETESEAAARELMEHDPAVRDGVMTAALHPYKIAGMRGITVGGA